MLSFTKIGCCVISRAAFEIINALEFTLIPNSVPSFGLTSKMIESVLLKLFGVKVVVVSPAISIPFLNHLYVVPDSVSLSVSV